MTNKEQDTKPPQSDGTTFPVTDDRERRADEFMEKSHGPILSQRCGYERGAARYAFLAGAESEAAHIAALNPTTALQLLDLVERLSRENAKMREGLERICKHSDPEFGWASLARECLAAIDATMNGDGNG